MRKLLVLLMAVFAFSPLVFAQQDLEDLPDQPKAELFVGYSYMRSNLENDSISTSGLNGINLQLTPYVYGNLGITADVTRGSGSNVAQSGINVYRWSYLFGPTYSWHTTSSLTPFVHALVGLDHERFSNQPAPDYISKSLGVDVGGGLDIRLADRVQLRLAQIDLLHTNHNSGQNAFRYATGLVFRF